MDSSTSAPLEAMRFSLQRGEMPDTATLLRRAASAEVFVWEQPAARTAIVGIGVAASIEVAGARRFADAEARVRELFARLAVRGASAPYDAGPLLVGGFAFRDHAPADAAWRGFPAGRLVLPKLLFVRRGERAWLTHVARRGDARCEARQLLALEAADQGPLPEPIRADPGPGRAARAIAHPPVSSFREGIQAALEAIRRGELEKVVLARSLRLQRPSVSTLARVVDRLRGTYPSSTTYGLTQRDGAIFAGATPERLLRLHRGIVETAAVAGSAPRGRTPEEDARLARALRESKKEQAEHAVVVRALHAALRDCSTWLQMPESPRLLALEGIQHLETRMRGALRSELRGAFSVLRLVARLHPTPAVGGAPRGPALSWIERHEGLERGWYAGPVGWLDATGEGEFVVALRCALLRAREARLFAGAGIVEGSDPERELHETQLKLQCLLDPILEI